jgi:hypothetical protein
MKFVPQPVGQMQWESALALMQRPVAQKWFANKIHIQKKFTSP